MTMIAGDEDRLRALLAAPCPVCHAAMTQRERRESRWMSQGSGHQDDVTDTNTVQEMVSVECTGCNRVAAEKRRVVVTEQSYYSLQQETTVGEWEYTFYRALHG